VPDACEDALRDFLVHAMPLFAFLDEMSEVDHNARTKLAVFRSSFKEWAKQQGVKNIPGDKTLKRKLVGLGLHVSKVNGYETLFGLPSAARLAAAELPRDFAMSESHDLMVKNGDIATVSGLDALPQRIKSCLSHQRGESPFYRDFGTRLAEYYRLLRDSPWFDRLLKLEVIRQAAIPYVDRIQNT